MSTTEPKFTITARGVSPDPRGGHTEREWDALFAAVARADGAAIEALVTGTTFTAPKARAEPLKAIHDRMARHAMFPTRNKGRGR